MVYCLSFIIFIVTRDRNIGYVYVCSIYSVLTHGLLFTLQVVFSTLLGLSVHGFPPPEDESINAFFQGFGQKLAPEASKRTGRGYPAADPNHNGRAGFAPPPSPSPITLNNRVVDQRLAASAGVRSESPMQPSFQRFITSDNLFNSI